MEMKQHTEYVFLDCFKLFCAFLVVGIHTEPFSHWFYIDKAFGVLTRIAVPFFFVATSYFFFSKPVSAKRLWSYCKRIFEIYFIWSLIYYIAERLLYGVFPEHMVLVFLVSGYDHLWFLHACIVSVCLMAALDNTVCKKSRPVAFLLIMAIYVFGLCISTYYPLFEGNKLLDTAANSVFVRYAGTRSGFFYGLLFVGMGYYFSKGNSLQLTLKENTLAVLISLVLLAIEGLIAVLFVHVTQTILWLFTIPLTFFVFALCLQIKTSNIENAVMIRRMSLGIYCVHPLIIMLVGNRLHPMILFPVVCVVSATVSFLYYSFRNKVPVRPK